ncbi:MAG TPA: DUF2442 domain-containing protein [Aeromonadales bacterium]|nr:DUF2442 domain-containing protein [Aeromonadales bacterium]
MSTLAVKLHPLAYSVKCTEDVLSVDLLDGRTITVPTAWFPTLSKATQTQRENWEILGDGEGIHWPEIDEDLSVSGLLAGTHR